MERGDIATQNDQSDFAVDMGDTQGENSDASKINKQKQRRQPPPHKPGIKEDLTVIAHLSILIFVTLIIYLCFCRTFELFTLHPLLMSIGWTLLMTEGVLIISKENPVVRQLRLNHTLKLRYHWIILTIASILLTVGLTIVALNLNKERLGKQHFKTWHGLLGILGAIGCIPALFNGTAALWDVELKSYIKPSVIKLIHQASGTVAFLFGGVSLILSVYTNWFVKASHNNKYLYLIGISSAIISVLWTLQRPLLKCFRKLFKLNI